MESVKIAPGIGGHGPQMLYSGGRQPPSGHPQAPQIIHPPTTRAYEGSPYKQTISPPIVSRGATYASYGPVVDSAHGGAAARYLQQQSAYLTYPRETHYVRPMTDRPLLIPHGSRRPSIMGSYGGYAKDMMQMMSSTSTLPVNTGGESYKRIKLSQGMRADVTYPPLVIDTSENHGSRESSYYPQVEAISPSLPPDPRDESPVHSNQDDFVKKIERVDKEISLIESSIANLEKKEKDLEVAAQKGDSQSEPEVEDLKEPKHQCTAQIIYAENRKKADESHSLLDKLIPPSEINRVKPLYHQPSDCQIYQVNKRKHATFKQSLLEYFKRCQERKADREQKLSQTYSKMMGEWLRKVDKIENSKKQKEKGAKNRELFEKVFPELRKQREDKERFSRVGARVKSDAEMEEIMDGLQEQENEDKKMRAYAVIPPIMLDERERRYQFVNKNGLIVNPLEEYKEYKNVNIWTEHESGVFKEKFLQHPKNFVLIASCLEKKSVSDCIHYYYLTKKKDNYKLLVKRRMRRPRAKGSNQPHMETIHLNTRVRTRGSTAAAQKELTKPEMIPRSAVVEDALGTSASSITNSICDEDFPEGVMNGPSVSSISMDWSQGHTENISGVTPMDVESGEENEASQMKSLSHPCISSTTPTVNNMEIGGDPENLSPSEILQRRIKEEEKSKNDLDSSDEENRNGTLYECILCNNRDFGNSRPIKPGLASQYGLKEEEVPPNARVCSNCRCRAVRRTRQYTCLIPTCTTAKWKVKRLRPFPTRWNHLPDSIKDPVIKEFQIPSDVNKSCPACHNRILRKLGSDAEEPLDVSRWTDENIETLRRALREVGCHWSKIVEKLPNKSQGQCRSFYSALKEKHKLDEAVAEYKRIKGKSDPPTVTDEEESGSSTSSSEETGVSQPTHNPPSQVRHDSASDTLSASSPPPPINSIEDKDAATIREHQNTNLPVREDYDSSATTLSADECPSGIERDSPPEVEHIPHPGEKRTPLPPSRTPNRISQFSHSNQGTEDVFQDIISKTISANLPDSDKAPSVNREITMETLLQPSSSTYSPYIAYEEEECEGGLDLTVRKRERSPPSHRPSSQPTGSSYPSNSIISPAVSTQRNDMPSMIVRGGAEVILTGKGSPPKAHSNSVSYPCFPMPDRYPPPDYRKSPIFLSDTRSLPSPSSSGVCNMVTRVPSPLTVYGGPGSRQAALPSKPPKASMAPPPPVAVSSPSMTQVCNLTQNTTRRMPHKPDKGPVTIHGSITLGTPVNQPSYPSTALSHPSRYDLVAKTIVNRESGSITQGTPVHHDPKRPSGVVPQSLHVKDNPMLDQRGGVEIIPRQAHEVLSRDGYKTQKSSSLIAPTSSYPFTSYSAYQQRSIYSDSQITSREIIKNDYLTSQQMQGRRGTPNEKELSVPQRRRDPSPQGMVKDTRAFPPTAIDRRTGDSMPTMIDQRAERRSDQRKEMNSLEFRPIDGRSVVQDRDKSRQQVQLIRTAAGLVPVHATSHYYATDMRGSRASSSPASVRDATPTPPTLDVLPHEYRGPVGLTGHVLPSHSRVNTVIQTANKTSASSSMRSEPGRYSPHSTIIPSGSDYVVSSRRDAKQIEGLGSVMIGNRHIYEPRPSSRDKGIHQALPEDKRYTDRRDRMSYKEEDNTEKHPMKYALDVKAMQSQRPRGVPNDTFAAKTLLDNIFMKSINRTGDECNQRDPRAYRREGDPPSSHGYSISSEADKRVRSPAVSYHQKEKDNLSLKDGQDMNATHRSQIHAESHTTSVHPPMAHHVNVNLLKTSQPHIDTVINREFASGIDLKKTPSNHHPYSRPTLEITRTDVRPGTHLNQYELSKIHSSASLMYPMDMDPSKERYESRSPHRTPASSSSSHHRDHLAKDERQIIRIAQPQAPHTEDASPYEVIQNRLQEIWCEGDGPEKDRRSHENARISRSGTPSMQRQIPIPHQSPSGHHSSMQQPITHSQQQSIRSNSHYDDDHLKKRPRLDLPQDCVQRPPSRPRSSGSENKEMLHREEVADSPQSGEMVIDENPPRDSQSIMKMGCDMSAGRPGAPNSQMSGEGLDKTGDRSRPKSSQYHNAFRGYPAHGSGPPVSLAPHTASWVVSAPPPPITSKNCCFQGYEPSVEPVSDAE